MKSIEEIIEGLTTLREEVAKHYRAAEETRYAPGNHVAHLGAVLRKLDNCVHTLGFKILNKAEVPRQPLGHAKTSHHLEEIHESYGYISINRVSGNTRLVGAMTDNLPTFIEMRVQASRRHIDPQTHGEHFFGYGPMLLVARMSSYQWAELITGMNTSGFPCTLKTVLNVDMDGVPEEVTTPLEQIGKNFTKRTETTKVEAEYFEVLEDLKSKIDNVGLSTKKADTLKADVHKLRKLVSAPKDAADWAARRVSEVTEKVISTTKIEIAAAINTAVTQAGMKQLQEPLTKQLPEGLKKDS